MSELMIWEIFIINKVMNISCKLIVIWQKLNVLKISLRVE